MKNGGRRVVAPASFGSPGFMLRATRAQPPRTGR
jgi:hypothetical protein